MDRLLRYMLVLRYTVQHAAREEDVWTVDIFCDIECKLLNLLYSGGQVPFTVTLPPTIKETTYSTHI